MGNQPSQLQYLDPRIRQIEVDDLKTFTGCSPELTNILNAELAILLKDANVPIPAQTNPMALLSDPRTDSNLRSTIKSVLLDRVDHAQLNQTVQSRFHQEPLMAALTCLYGNHWILDRQAFEATDYTKTFFTLTDNLSIGEFGSVYRGERTTMPFIIRTQNKSENAERSIHEAFVALRFLNPLRGVCPNFSVILGTFMCGNPDSITGKICNGPNPVQYMIYENIPGQNIYEYTESLRIPQPTPGVNYDEIAKNIFVSIFQIILALRYARKSCRFSHRDLHGGNVVLRPLDKEFWIPYDSAGFEMDDYLRNVPPGHRKIFYIRSSQVSTIIDYETSEVFLPIPAGNGPLVSFGIQTGNSTERTYSDPILSSMRDVQKFLYSMIGALGYSLHVPLGVNECVVNTFVDLVWPGHSNESFGAKTGHIRNFYADGNVGIRSKNIEDIRIGKIHPDKFLSVFLKNLPPKYRDAIYLERNVTAENQQTIESAIVQSTGITILRSGNPESASANLKAILNSTSTAETPIQIARRVEEQVRSYTYFKTARIEERRQNLEKRLLNDERQISQIEKDRLLKEHAKICADVSQILSKFKLPDPDRFTLEYSADYGMGVIAYRTTISEIFRLYRMGRDVIALNNSFMYSNSLTALAPREKTHQCLNQINEFFARKVIPWRDAVLRLSNSKHFGYANADMITAVLTRFPSNLAFDKF